MFDSIQLSPIFFLMGPLGIREKSGKSFQNATPRSGGSGTKVKERRVKLIPGRLGTVETSAAVIPVCSAAQQPCPKRPSHVPRRPRGSLDRVENPFGTEGSIWWAHLEPQI